MILEKDYAVFYWLDCQLSKEEFSAFIQNLEQVNDKHKISLIDGVDEDEQSVCFKFNQVVPTKPQEVKLCKVRNEQNCKRFMQALSKKIDARLYFNVNHKVIKRK